MDPTDEACVFDLGSLYDRFDQLPDKRQARGKRYAHVLCSIAPRCSARSAGTGCALILTLILLAKLSGEDTPYGIAAWARLRQDALVKLLGLERQSLPGHNTYRRVADRAVEPRWLQNETSAFLTSRSGAGHSVLVSLDGKTLRGTLWLKETRGVHLLAAYLPREGLVLMQILVEHHENEISAAPQVLKCLDLRGKIVMGDALHTSSCAACCARLHANACGTGHARIVHSDFRRRGRVSLVRQKKPADLAPRHRTAFSTRNLWSRLKPHAHRFRV